MHVRTYFGDTMQLITTFNKYHTGRVVQLIRKGKIHREHRDMLAGLGFVYPDESFSVEEYQEEVRKIKGF